MKVQMMNNKLIYDLEDTGKQYCPNEQGVWSGPILLEDIDTYLKSGHESIVLKKWTPSTNHKEAPQ